MPLPSRHRDELDEPGRAVWDAVVASRGPGAVDADGHLAGPFNAFVHAPAIGACLTSLGGTLRFESSIDPLLIELAILTVGARWHAEFEWWAHARLARQLGVSDDTLAAIARSETPALASAGERAVHAFAYQLAATGRVDPATYGEAQQLLGDSGLVELVALCGYYSLVSWLLNTFEVPLPAGVEPQWGT
jgi:4-carboxymuconolactone decarboxylase